jgi:hypothetical protein
MYYQTPPKLFNNTLQLAENAVEAKNPFRSHNIVRMNRSPGIIILLGPLTLNSTLKLQLSCSLLYCLNNCNPIQIPFFKAAIWSNKLI